MNRRKNITLIGFGKLGSALYYALKARGYNINTIVEKNPVIYSKIKLLNKRIKVFNSVNNSSILNCDILILAVKDSQLELLINQIDKLCIDFKEKIVFHTSGAKSSGIIKIKGLLNKNKGSFHPIQTFNIISNKDAGLLRNIYIGIEGGQNFVKFATGIIQDLNSYRLLINSAKKEIYHLAGVFSSNFIVTFLSILEKISLKAGISKNKALEIYKPIIYKTVENIFNYGTSKSLSGPFERGDIDTIKMHLSKIKKEKVFKELYLILGKEALDLAISKKSIKLKQKKEIERILK